MKIIELILGDGIFSGIEAISLVSAGAIEEDFIALKSQEVKLAEVSSEKRILMGALLVPNKPIYRKTGDDEYYIYFSKKTIEKASQLYLMNGNQNNATLEHQHSLKGLTLVESWLVQDEVHDKSRKYGLDVPVGTWMGAVKVNNDDVWEEFVRSGKVKSFSIEGYFADKAERPKEPINDIEPINDLEPINDMEMQAQEQLSTIRTIIKDGERIELSLIGDLNKEIQEAKRIIDYQKDGYKWLQKTQDAYKEYKKVWSDAEGIIRGGDKQADKQLDVLGDAIAKLGKSATEIGVKPEGIAEYKEGLKKLGELRDNRGSGVDFQKELDKIK